MACIMITGYITSMVLYRHILEPRPKRDITVNSNIWPLILPASSFSESGQKIRKVALYICVLLIVVMVVTLLTVGAFLWLG
jgi:hypothetical protein